MPAQELENVVDLFCGAGGLSTGFSKAGYNIVTGVDNNEHSLKTFQHNHNCDPLLADLEGPNILEEIKSSIHHNGYSTDDIDLVIGGPPCRGFSMANINTDSGGHPLNNLPAKFLDIVQYLDPDAVLIENVPRLLTVSDGEFKRSIISRLESFGYNVCFGVLNSVEFGVPQKRRRVFFLGHKYTKPNLPDPNDFDLDFSLPVSVSDAISDLPDLPTGGGGKLETQYTALASELSGYVSDLREGAKDDVIMNHRTTKNQKRTYKRFEYIPQGGNWRDIPEHLMDNYSNRESTHDHIYQRLIEDEPAKTVANFRKQMIVHPTQDRLLSVREAARLQSFPDGYHFKGDSFNARQQMVGDAVPVNLAFAISRAIAGEKRVI